jgi:hypothetical protein
LIDPGLRSRDPGGAEPYSLETALQRRHFLLLVFLNGLRFPGAI